MSRVWSAITESDQLRHWMPCDIVGERRTGSDITLPFWSAQIEKYQLEETMLTGRIEVWDAPHVFQWTWGGDVLRFELRADDAGTTMTFTTWLESPDLEGAASAAGGYHVCLDELAVSPGHRLGRSADRERRGRSPPANRIRRGSDNSVLRVQNLSSSYAGRASPRSAPLELTKFQSRRPT